MLGMRCLPTTGLAALAAGVAALALGVGPAAGAPPSPVTMAPRPGTMPHSARVTATVDDCHTGPAASDRYAAFSGQMMLIPRATSMAMRFSLIGQPSPTGAPERMNAPGLGVWQRSAPHIAIFRYRQEVTNLTPGSSFRALISYRWLDASGKVIKHAVRHTPKCDIPDLRPHLTVGSVVQRAGLDPQSSAYDVDAHNAGLGPAGAFQVALTVNGNSLAPQSIPSLAPGADQTVTFAGPRCNPGSSIQVTLDPGNQVDEATRADNVKTVGC